MIATRSSPWTFPPQRRRRILLPPWAAATSYVSHGRGAWPPIPPSAAVTLFRGARDGMAMKSTLTIFVRREEPIAGSRGTAKHGPGRIWQLNLTMVHFLVRSSLPLPAPSLRPAVPAVVMNSGERFVNAATNFVVGGPVRDLSWAEFRRTWISRRMRSGGDLKVDQKMGGHVLGDRPRTSARSACGKKSGTARPLPLRSPPTAPEAYDAAVPQARGGVR